MVVGLQRVWLRNAGLSVALAALALATRPHDTVARRFDASNLEVQRYERHHTKKKTFQINEGESSQTTTPPPSQDLLEIVIEKAEAQVMAVLLVCFMVFDMGILYAVNASDPQVRSYSYKMLSSCITIFLAVIVERADADFFIFLITKFSEDELTHEVLHIAAETLLFVIWFACCSLVSYGTSEHEAIFAAGGTVAHIAAFTAIAVLGHVQEHSAHAWEHDGNRTALVCCYTFSPLLVIVYFALFSGAAHLVRHCMIKRFGEEQLDHMMPHIDNHVRASQHIPGYIDVNRNGTVSVKEWQEAVDRAVSEKLAEISEDAANNDGSKAHNDKVPEEAAGNTTVATVGKDEKRWSLKNHTVEAMNSAGLHHHTAHWLDEAEELEDDCQAVVMGFFVRQSILFFTTGRAPQMVGDFAKHTVMHFCSLGSFILVLMIGSVLVSHFKGSKGPSRMMNQLQMILNMSIAWCLLSFSRWFSQQVVNDKTIMFIIVAIIVSPISFVMISVLDSLADRGIMKGQSAEEIIVSLGLLVGLAWEKAFLKSLDKVLGRVESEHGKGNIYGLVIEAALFVLLFGALIPAWWWFIVPEACQPVPERDHPKDRIEGHSADGTDESCRETKAIDAQSATAVLDGTSACEEEKTTSKPVETTPRDFQPASSTQ